MSEERTVDTYRIYLEHYLSITGDPPPVFPGSIPPPPPTSELAAMALAACHAKTGTQPWVRSAVERFVAGRPT